MQRVTRRFEGPDLEALLGEVRSSLGEDAVITAAHKVRAGGVGGFFSRQHFEVEAEMPGDVVTPEQAPASPSAATPMAAAPAPEPTPDPAPRSLLDLADRVSAAERAAAGRTGTDDDDHAAFAAVLRRVVEERTTPPAAGSAPDDDAAATEVTVSADEQPFVPVALAEPAARLAVPADPEDATPVTPAPAPAMAPVSSAPPDPPETEPAHTAVVVATPRTRPSETPADPVAPTIAALLRCGLPAAYVPVGPLQTCLSTALAELLAELPPPPPAPARAGSVVAVVGRRDDALSLARELAGEIGVGEDAIVLAAPAYKGRRIPTWRRLEDAGAAAEERRSWRRRQHATVVAVESSPGRRGVDWARDVLDALEPTVAWGIVEATRKTEDVAGWIHAIGGLDVLALEDVDATVTPGSILQLGIPVGRLDGQPATPGRWAELLVDAVGTVFPTETSRPDALVART